MQDCSRYSRSRREPSTGHPHSSPSININTKQILEQDISKGQNESFEFMKGIKLSGFIKRGTHSKEINLLQIMKSEEEDYKGFLISCDRNREREAVKEAYNFLEQSIQDIYSDLTSQNIQKHIKKDGKQVNLLNEVQYQKKAEHRLLSQVDTKVNCLCFIKINQEYRQIDPLAVVSKLMKEVHGEGRLVARYCHRILPVQKAFRAEHFKMLDEIDNLFLSHTLPGEIKSWVLHFRCRNNSKFQYKEILKQVELLAKKYRHFPDIYYPQWTICIQVTHHLMCLSICEQFQETNEFKLHKITPEKEGKSEQQKIQSSIKPKKDLKVAKKKSVSRNEGQREDSSQNEEKRLQKQKKKVFLMQERIEEDSEQIELI